jgi:hypothetical protein
MSFGHYTPFPVSEDIVMTRTVLAACALIGLSLLGCQREQAQMIRNAERESLFGPPPALSWDLSDPVRNGRGDSGFSGGAYP